MLYCCLGMSWILCNHICCIVLLCWDVLEFLCKKQIVVFWLCCQRPIIQPGRRQWLVAEMYMSAISYIMLIFTRKLTYLFDSGGGWHFPRFLVRVVSTQWTTWPNSIWKYQKEVVDKILYWNKLQAKIPRLKRNVSVHCVVRYHGSIRATFL